MSSQYLPVHSYRQGKSPETEDQAEGRERPKKEAGHSRLVINGVY